MLNKVKIKKVKITIKIYKIKIISKEEDNNNYSIYLIMKKNRDELYIIQWSFLNNEDDDNKSHEIS